MSKFSYENKWSRPIQFEFDIDSMVIKEMWIGNVPREIKFKYDDIKEYRISFSWLLYIVVLCK